MHLTQLLTNLDARTDTTRATHLENRAANRGAANQATHLEGQIEPPGTNRAETNRAGTNRAQGQIEQGQIEQGQIEQGQIVRTNRATCGQIEPPTLTGVWGNGQIEPPTLTGVWGNDIVRPSICQRFLVWGGL